MRIGLVILNRNESLGVDWLLPKLDLSLFEDCFAVDGFSEDDSAEKLRAFGIEVLTQGSNGRGVAFALAFSEAQKRGLDALCFISSDGNENPADLREMKSSLLAGNELVIGSRMMQGAFNEEDVSWFRPRKWANNIFARVGWVIFGRNQKYITDPINGYRGLTSRAWSQLRVISKGYGIEFESSLKAYVLKLRVLEFPTIEGQRVGGHSGATPIKTSLAMLTAIGNTRSFVKEPLGAASGKRK